MNKKLVLILITIPIILAIGYTAYTGYFISTSDRVVAVVSTSDRVVVVVSRVIDGDTIELVDGTRVRLIGIDAEERGIKCYQEAKDRLKQLVEGKDVILERDKTDKDRYKRLLRYVFVGNDFINLILVREGLARVYTIQPDVKYLNQFEQAFLLARNENGCIWRAS